MKTVVYRVQKPGVKLHSIRTRTSADELANGVHVFWGFGSVDVGEWNLNQRNVELAKISCDSKDLRDSGDVQGYVLRKGKGEIVDRLRFRTLRSLQEWARSLQMNGVEW
jgi:hypothetical protein